MKNLEERVQELEARCEALEAKQPKEPSAFQKACIESVMKDAGNKQGQRFQKTVEFAANYALGDTYQGQVITRVDYQQQLIQVNNTDFWFAPASESNEPLSFKYREDETGRHYEINKIIELPDDTFELKFEPKLHSLFEVGSMLAGADADYVCNKVDRVKGILTFVRATKKEENK